jgi:autotransporter adhesin
MNRIYRRIWNAVRQCWVVASELASPKGKANRACCAVLLMASNLPAVAHGSTTETDEDLYQTLHRDVLMAEAEQGSGSAAFALPQLVLPSANTLLASSQLGISSYSGPIYQPGKSVPVLIVDPDYKASSFLGYDLVLSGSRSTLHGHHSVAYGNGIRAIGDNVTAVGSNAVSTGGYATAVGAGAQALELGASAFGNSARAEKNNAVAIGSGARAWSANSVAIGANSAAVDSFTVSVGTSVQTRRIVNVTDGRITDSSNDAVTGRQLYATNSKIGAIEGMIRSGQHSDAYALGAGSVTASAKSISVGSASNKRRIQYLADGTVAAGSTDAVTGSQLHSTNQAVSAARTTADAAKASAATAQNLAQSASNRIDATTLALGKGAVAEHGSYGISTALGNNAKAYNGQSIAVGYDALSGVDADGKKVTGQNAGVSIGASTRSANGAVAAGFRASATGNFSIAVGGDAKAAAEHGTAMGYLSKASASQSTALGRGSEATAQFATASGNLAKATAISAVALGDRAQATHENAVALGAGAVTASSNSVSVGSASRKRKIQYVADGVVASGSTDAITGNQLHATNQAVTTAQTTANSAKTNADSALTQAKTLAGLVGQVSATGAVRLGGENTGTVLDVRNKGNASRKISGVADATLSASSTEAVTGRQLTATNVEVKGAKDAAAAAQSAAATAAVDAGAALAQSKVLSGLVSQASATGNVRLGGDNSGNVVDVRNKSNANRKISGVADAALNATSTDAVSGKQLNETNTNVSNAQNVADAAKLDAGKALADAAALGGLIGQVAANGNVRIGEKNNGTVLDIRSSAGQGRRIIGVAEGVISAGSSDAVSGRQLYATESRVSALEEKGQYLSIGVDAFSQRAEAGLLGVAIGDSAKAGPDGGTAIGAFALSDGINSVAIGRGSTVSERSSSGFALGAGAQVDAMDGVAIGAGSKVRAGASGSLAIGAGAEVTEAGTASFGTATSGRRLVNIGRGTAGHNAVTVDQLNESLAVLGGGVTLDERGNIISPTYMVQGGTQNTVEDALMALDGAVITAGRRADKVEGQLSSIFQDSPSARVDGMNQIALNGVNGMVLTNLADGRVAPGSRDAVTGSQLYAAEQKISQNRNDLEAMRKEREMGEQAMRGLDASGPIDFGGARLTGVAEAGLSADSSDVVRGSQLYETNSRVSAMEGISQYVSVGTAPEYGGAQAGPVGLAIGNLAKTGIEGGTAIGTFAEAMGKNSIAIGRASTVFQGSDSSFAVGTGAEVGRAGEPGAIGAIAFGAGSRVEPGAHGSIALGTSSYAAEAGVVSFGSVGTKRRLVNIANGTANHNAATVGQLRGALSALGGEVDANGNIVGLSFNVQGQSQSTLNGALEALDGAVVSTTSRVNQVESQLRSVFQETPSARADGTQQLTLAGANGMVISNVANGLIAAGSRDAVNGGQLHSMQQQLNGRMDGLEQRIDDQSQAHALAAASTPSPSTEEIAPTAETSGSPQIASTGEGDKPAPQPKSKQDDTPKPQVDTADLEKMLARANEYTDGAISNFERRLDKMDKRFNRMAAMSSAQSAMAMNTAGLATYNRLGAGVGYSEGESAMAVGYQRVLNEKGSATFSLNGAFTNSGERSMGVGVGIGW